MLLHCGDCCGAPPDMVNIPGCPCSQSPRTLYMTSSNHESNNGMFQDATIVYGPTPTGLLPLGLGTDCYLSTAQFEDLSTGDMFWYNLSCYFGAYVLTRVYEFSFYASPYRDMIRYTWAMANTGNHCSPFLLAVGQVFAGGDTACVVTISP